MRTINKIRKMLGTRYHLSVERGIGLEKETEITQWMLFRNYENGDPIYWSDDNKPIMRSEENTIEELYDFAKSHKRIDPIRTILKFNFFVLLIVCIIAFVNIYLSSAFLRGVVITTGIIVLSIDGILHYISNKNFKIDNRELTENWIRRMEKLYPTDQNLKQEEVQKISKI